MKKIVLLCLFFVIVFTSCNNDIQSPVVEVVAPVKKESRCYLPVAEELGDVCNVFRASASRFIDGEVVLNYRLENPENKDLVFVAELVEYNNFNQNVVNYILEKHSEYNAMFHQHYDVTFKADKTYVEYGSFIDNETGEVLVIEIRIANGSDILDYNGSYYAISCRFNKDMSRDLDLTTETPFKVNPQVVDLGKIPDAKVVYDCNTGEVNYSEDNKSGSPLPLIDMNEMRGFIDRLALSLGNLKEEYEIKESEFKRNDSIVNRVCATYRYGEIDNYLIEKANNTEYNAQSYNREEKMYSEIINEEYPNDFYVQIVLFSERPSVVDIRIMDQDLFRSYYNNPPQKGEEWWFAKSIDLTYGEVKDIFDVVCDSF